MNWIRAEHYINEARLAQKIVIAFLAKPCYGGRVMARVMDVLRAIRNRLAHDASQLDEAAKEMDKLSPQYNRFLDLQHKAVEHEQSIQGLMALLGPKFFCEAARTDETDAIGNQVEITPSPATLRAKSQLWESVHHYLRFVSEGEAQVPAILDFLAWVEIKTSRQAVESCIRTHPKVFRVRKKGRAKFISLAEGWPKKI